MVSTALAGPNGAARHAERAIDMRASSALSAWLRDHPAVARELEEAVQARIHFGEVDRRARAAEASATAAERRSAGEAVKLDPGGHRVLRPIVASALLAALAVLDGWLSYLAATAFGLDAVGTCLVTGILLAAATVMIAATEASGERRRLMLGAGVVITCLALAVLRAGFLVTRDGVINAFLQSVTLIAISACLALSGSTVLGRTCDLRLARAQAAARRSRRDAEAKNTARAAAAERMQRHFGALKQLLIHWALSSPAPADIDHVSWTAALHQAVKELFAEL